MLDKLFEAAKAAQASAYAPYSQYRVGASVLGADGRIYHGCNVENSSYGLTICAERAAIAAMVSAGCQEIRQVAIVTDDGGTPCGMCRQTLAEFAPKPDEVTILTFDEDANVGKYQLSALLPSPFSVKPQLAQPLNE